MPAYGRPEPDAARSLNFQIPARRREKDQHTIELPLPKASSRPEAGSRDTQDNKALMRSRLPFRRLVRASEMPFCQSHCCALGSLHLDLAIPNQIAPALDVQLN
jgi:hypothetical protein